jgi:hypothetical protein
VAVEVKIVLVIRQIQLKKFQAHPVYGKFPETVWVRFKSKCIEISVTSEGGSLKKLIMKI